MSHTTQILAVSFVLMAGFMLWTILSKDPETAALTSISSSADSPVGDSKVLETLINMRNLRLDDRLFSNPAFQALVNTERKIIPEPVGRRNPFSPIGSDTDVLPPAQPEDVNPQETPESVE